MSYDNNIDRTTNNKDHLDNSFINILDKNNRIKRLIELKYEINNPILLEDPKFRSIIICKAWFNTSNKDMYMKLILNPFMKTKDYQKIEKIKEHHEKNISTFFYPLFILHIIWIKTLFSGKNLNGIKRKIVAISTIPFLFTLHNYLLKPFYLQEKLNKIIIGDEIFKNYLSLPLEEKLINQELIN